MFKYLILQAYLQEGKLNQISKESQIPSTSTFFSW
jgi:hypothetical protein